MARYTERINMQWDDSSGSKPVEELEASTSNGGTVLLKDEYQPGRVFYVLTQLRRRQQFCDVQVYKDAACFSAHRVILAASSPYLMSLLQSPCSSNKMDEEGKTAQITLTDPRLTVGALELLIDFMYTSMLRIKESTVEALCYAARLLQLSRIEKACVKFIVNSLSPQNCFHYLSYAEENCYPQIKTKCLEQAARNFPCASRTEGFLDISFENLFNIVRSPHLTAPSQETVLESVLEWVNHDSESRQNDLYPLLQSVKEHSFLQQSREKVTEILNSPRTTTEQVVRSLRACFEKLQWRQEVVREKGKGEIREEQRRETPSGESDTEQQKKPTPPDSGKIRRKVRFETDEEAPDEDAPSKLPESKRRYTDRETKNAATTTEQEMVTERSEGEGSKVTRKKKPSLIFAAGGITASSSNTSSVEKYDVSKKDWAAATALPQKKSHAALVSSGDKLYSIGGYNGSKRLASVDVFDTVSEQWSGGAPMPTARSGFGATVDKDGHIYCVGGYSSTQQDMSDVDVYDPERDQWTPAPPLTQRRSYVQAATLGDNVYAVGGMERNTRLHTVEKLSPYTSAWSRVADMNVARSRPGVAALNGRLFAVGGYNGREHLSSAECYSPNSDTWRMLESMSVPRNSPATAVHNGCLYVAGGHSGKTLLQNVERYDPHTNKWLTVAPMSTARCDFGMAVLDRGSGGSARERRTEPQPVGTWI